MYKQLIDHVSNCTDVLERSGDSPFKTKRAVVYVTGKNDESLALTIELDLNAELYKGTIIGTGKTHVTIRKTGENDFPYFTDTARTEKDILAFYELWEALQAKIEAKRKKEREEVYASIQFSFLSKP